VSFSPSKSKLALAAFAVVALTASGARAQQAPSPAAIGYANQILVDIGMKPALDQVVPAMLAQLERSVTTTRPELKEPLHAVVVALEPEFAKTEQPVFDEAAKYLAGQLSEQELKDVAAFYESTTGKKFIVTQPPLMAEVGNLVGVWRNKLSTDILARAREEMAKKGYSF